MSDLAFENLSAKLLRTLRRIVPKGSALDTIFDSYDDWREFETEKSAETAEKEKEKNGARREF